MHRSALCHKLLIALSGKFDIAFRGFPGPFFKRMKHIDRFRKLDDITDTMFHRGMDSHLTDAGTNRRHRLPVRRLQPLLNLTELKTCEPPRIRRECLEVMPR